MTLYIDPPVWPAHATVFSHLISDTSIAELHSFAQAAGVSQRAFDRDHYDVPEHRYDELIRRGAQPVSGHQLVTILMRSGLRVKARDRQEKLRAGLQRRWTRMAPSDDAALLTGWQPVGADLISRWDHPGRHYHALPHLSSVLRIAHRLHRNGELHHDLLQPVLLAGWFHDAVYNGIAGQDEEDSAYLAQRQLDGLLPSHQVEETARLVRLTATHAPETDDISGAVLVDADLEVLSRDGAAYWRYVDQVRADYAHVPENQFATGRTQVLKNLLATPRLFHTRTGYQLWEAVARANLTAELAHWQLGRPIL